MFQQIWGVLYEVCQANLPINVPTMCQSKYGLFDKALAQPVESSQMLQVSKYCHITTSINGIGHKEQQYKKLQHNVAKITYQTFPIYQG